MSEVELESCPWPECGQYYPVHDRFGTKHTYVCYGCGARGPLADTVEEARRLWNTRTPVWTAIEDVPKEWKDGRELLGYGLWAGEINGPDDEPVRCIIYWSGGTTDYPGYEWTVAHTDGYAAWMRPTFVALPPPPPKGE